MNSQFATVPTSIPIAQNTLTSIIMIFTPQALIPFTQDNKTIHVYPKLQDIEDEIERTFGWYATINSINDSILKKNIFMSTNLQKVAFPDPISVFFFLRP